MDKLESHKDRHTSSEKPNSDNKSPPPTDAPPPKNTTTMKATTNRGFSRSYSFGNDTGVREVGDDVDVMIRIAFIEFLFSSEILGLVERHVCVFRLFPRPVVTLKQVAFLSSYEKACSNTDKSFIKELIRSQVSLALCNFCALVHMCK